MRVKSVSSNELKGLQEESLRKTVCIRDQFVRELVWANETRD